MKKLALGIATLLFAGTPVFACPDMESGGHEKGTIKTADKDNKKTDAKDAGQTQTKAKDKAKAKTAKPAPKKDAPKKGEKVSQK